MMNMQANHPINRVKGAFEWLDSLAMRYCMSYLPGLRETSEAFFLACATALLVCHTSVSFGMHCNTAISLSIYINSIHPIFFEYWRTLYLPTKLTGYFISTATNSLSRAIATGPVLILPLLIFGGYFVSNKWVKQLRYLGRMLIY